MNARTMLSTLSIVMWGLISVIYADPSSPPSPRPGLASNGVPQPRQLNRPKLVIQTGHSGGVTSVAFSPDGRQVLTAGSWDSTARLWDTASGREIRKFQGHTGGIEVAAFSPDGRHVLTAGSDFTARVWEVATGKEIRRFPGFSYGAFSPDGRHVLTDNGKVAVLFDVATGREIRRFKGHESSIMAVVFSPDGKWLLSGSDDKTARLWDVSTGREFRRLEGHAGTIGAVAFSQNGRRVLTGSDDQTARLWDATTGKLIRRLEEHSSKVVSVAFSADGQRVLTGSIAMVRLWDTATGAELRRLDSHGAMGGLATLSPNGRWILTGGSLGTAYLWDASTGKEIRRFVGDAEQIASVAVSPNGQRLLTGGRKACLWDAETGREIRRFEVDLGVYLRSVVFSPDGKNLLTAGAEMSDDLELEATVRLWDVATGREIQRFVGHADEVCCATFSSDGHQLLTGSADKTARLWDVPTGREIARFEGHVDGVHCVAFSPDGPRVLTGSRMARLWDTETRQQILPPFDWRQSVSINSVAFSPDGRQILTAGWGSVRVSEAATGEEIRRFDAQSKKVLSAVFSPDGGHILTGGSDNVARLWDAFTGNEFREFAGHAGTVQSVAFSAKGRFVITGSSDNTTRLWNATTGQELCKLVSFRDGWAVVDPEGRYDASNGGDVEGLHWVVGNEPIALSQLKKRYYDPSLLAKIMGFNTERLRDVGAFTNPKLYPEIELSQPTPENPKLGIQLTARDGGIGQVVVMINGKELTADARGPSPDPEAKELSLELSLEGDPRLKYGEENEVEVFAYNAEGYLRSRGSRRVFRVPGQQLRRPSLWVIVVGVSDYQGDAIDLRYAGKDAEDFSTALGVAGRRLFGDDRIHMALLSSGQDDPAFRPSRENIVKAFEAATKAKASDILVVYLSGHGVNYGGQDGDFYFLTSDARTADLGDPEIRAQTGLSSHELTELIKAIPALKQVLILDTCASGLLIEKLTQRREVPSSQKRALERLKDRTGMHVLAGCAADAVSYEASQYAQGLLTHTLLLGMRGAALREDEFVDASTLFNFAVDRVPELARGIGGIQRPDVRVPKGSKSFDIGQVLGEDKSQIPLQAARPLVLRANLQEEEEFDDVLGLARLIDRAFRDVSTRGRNAPLVFVDAREFPEAYRVTGRYRVEGDRVSVTLNVFRGRDKVKAVSVEGKRQSLDDLVADIVAEVERCLTSQP